MNANYGGVSAIYNGGLSSPSVYQSGSGLGRFYKKILKPVVKQVKKSKLASGAVGLAGDIVSAAGLEKTGAKLLDASDRIEKRGLGRKRKQTGGKKTKKSKK